MRFSEIWSVPSGRITDYFLSQEDVHEDGKDRFSCGECLIRITPLPPRKIGRFSFPQTRVEFSGPDGDTEKVRRRFILQFISAGG